MKILLEITLLVALNLFLFFYVQRKMILLIAVQHQQLAVYKRTKKRPKLKERDRLFWIFLSKIWADWKGHLIIVNPETVIRWHHRKFKNYWRKLSKRKKKPYPFFQNPVKCAHIKFILQKLCQYGRFCSLWRPTHFYRILKKRERIPLKVS